MNEKKQKFKIEYVIIIFVLSTLVKADILLLGITPEVQVTPNVCWVSVSDMFLEFYGLSSNPYGIWQEGTGGEDLGNGMCEYPSSVDYKNMADILNYYESGVAYGGCKLNSLVYNDLTADFQNYKPVVAGLTYTSGGGHVVLLVGTSISNGVQMITYDDPLDGGQHTAIYSVFTSNVYFNWDESLVATYGSLSGTVPVLPACISITSGPTQFTYPGTSATYKSSFYCPYGQICSSVNSWNWSLSFNHNAGNYTVSSVQNLSGNNASTWNIGAFTLPTSGYQWIYNEAGLVTGIVTVTGGGYSAWEAVTYRPQVVFPGELSLGPLTVTGVRPKDQAHYCMDLNGVAVQSGGSMSLVAGSCFSIENLTVNNGASLTATIDPTLQ